MPLIISMMSLSFRMLAAAACLAILVQPLAFAKPSRNQEKEEKLIAKIEREKNPGKKARLQVRLAKLKLEDADEAYHSRKFAEGKSLLYQYLDLVRASWDTLQGTNNALKKHVRAFMQLEISLREDGRFLDDMRHRVPYPESESVKEIEEESSSIHNQVLEAIFPGGFPRKQRSRRSTPPKSSAPAKVGAARS